MYKIKRAFELPANIELPKCMYRVNPIVNNLNQTESNSNGTLETVPEPTRKGLHESNANNIAQQNNINSTINLNEQLKTPGKRKRSRSPPKGSSPSVKQGQRKEVPMDTSEDVTSQTDSGEQIISKLEARQQEVISKLLRLRDLLNNVSGSSAGVGSQSSSTGVNEIQQSVEAVVTVDPETPPYSVLFLAKLLKNNYGSGVTLKSHLHSSCTAKLSENAKLFDQSTTEDRRGKLITISVIWKKKGEDREAELLVQPSVQAPIRGEANVARYLSRLLPSSDSINYDSLTWDDIIRVDALLEKFADGIAELGVLEEHLKNNQPYLFGEPTIADFVVFSAVTSYLNINSKQRGKFSLVSKWLSTCQEFGGFGV